MAWLCSKPSRSMSNRDQQRTFQVDGNLQAAARWLLAPCVPDRRCTWPAYLYGSYFLGASDAGHGRIHTHVVLF